MKTKSVLLVFISLLMMSCKNEEKKVENDLDVVETKIDSSIVNIEKPKTVENWQGEYKGTLPCDDCPGIETTLTLKKDNTYILETLYIGNKGKKPLQDEGTFTWGDIDDVISLEGVEDGKPFLYQVGDNTLTQLDMQGYPHTDKLADKYILKKVN